MELMLLIPLAAAAIGLYLLFKPPYEPTAGELTEPSADNPGTLEDATGAVATVHSASSIANRSIGD